MNRTIDAKVFFLQPGSSDLPRIEELIEKESCEAFILEDPNLAKTLILQLDKSILVIDATTYTHHETLNNFLNSIIESCGDKLFKVFVIEPLEGIISHHKVYILKRDQINDNQKILEVLDEMSLWGMRKYLRFGSQNSRIAFFRMKSGSQWRTGVIHDISASGMSCSFDRYLDIDVNEQSSSIELCIKDKIFKLEGNFLIRRTFKQGNMFVLVFSRKRGRGNIHRLNSIIYKLTREQVLEKIEKLV